MGISIVVTRVACNTGVGNQTITNTDLNGLTPKAVKFVIVRATADGTPLAGAAIGIGAADATREWVAAISSRDANATSVAKTRGATDECVMILNPVDGSVDGEASFVSFGVNSVTINWGNAPAAAYLLTVTLFAGSDLSAYVDTATNSGVGVPINIVAPGFEPDVVYNISTGYNINVDSTQAHAFLSYGVALNETPVLHRSWAIREGDASGTSQIAARFSDLYAIMQIDNTGGVAWGAVYSDFDADGFTITAAIGNKDRSGYIALAFNGVAQFWADTIDTPTAPGNQSQVGPEFIPQFVDLGITQIETINAGITDGDAGSFGASSFDGSSEYSSSVQIEDAQVTTDTQSLSDDIAINLPNDDGSAGHIAPFVEFIASGWTLNFTTTEGTAVKDWALAVEEPRPPRYGFTNFQIPGIV